MPRHCRRSPRPGGGQILSEGRCRRQFLGARRRRFHEARRRAPRCCPRLRRRTLNEGCTSFNFPPKIVIQFEFGAQKGSELTVDGAPLVVGRAVESRMLSVAVEVLVGEGAEERETSLFDRLKREIMMMTKG